MELARAAEKRKSSENESESRKVQRTTVRAVTRPFFVSHDTTPTDTVFVSHDCIITHATQAGNVAVNVRERV